MQLKDILLAYGEWLDADQKLMAPTEDGDRRTHEDLAEQFLAGGKYMGSTTIPLSELPPITGPVTINSIVPESDTKLQLERAQAQNEELSRALALEKNRTQSLRANLKQMATWRDNCREEAEAAQRRCAEYISKGYVDGLLVLDGIDCSPANVRNWVNRAFELECEVEQLKVVNGDVRKTQNEIHTALLQSEAETKQLTAALEAMTQYAAGLANLFTVLTGQAAA